MHEIKHDGFRIIARRDAGGVRLITRNGYNFTSRFPLANEAIATLPARSCVVDGEAIACDENGLAVFEMYVGASTIMLSPFVRSISSNSTGRISVENRSKSESAR